jgi:excisionase family DNA binding protein
MIRVSQMSPPKTPSTASKEEFVPSKRKWDPPLPEFATASQIAKALQVTSRTILEWEAAGKIPAALRTGRTVRFHPGEVAKGSGHSPCGVESVPVSRVSPHKYE